MLTTLIKRQLVIFAILSVAALTFTSVTYAKLPHMLGLSTYTVSAEFEDISGLYPRAIVTYRGVDVGIVESVDLTGDAVRVRMSIDRGTDIPQSSHVEVRSTSAIGEQYVDLVPDSKEGPFLAEGDVIGREQTSEMLQISPVLEKLDSLLQSVPTQATSDLLDQVDEGFGGSADELASIVDDTSDVVDAADDSLDTTTSLVHAASPLLVTQQKLADQTRSYASSLNTFTRTLAASDADVRRLIGSGQQVDELTTTVKAISPSLPLMLANTATVAEVLNASSTNLTLMLSVWPAMIARQAGALYDRVEEGDGHLDLKATFNDPESCITGYTPLEDRREPGDTSFRAVGKPYCTAPTTAPVGVRGARNLPCANDPARRGPTMASCGIVFGGATTRLGGSSSLAEGVTRQPEDDPATGTSTSTKENEAWQILLTGPLGK